jgi:hypothetical protein
MKIFNRAAAMTAMALLIGFVIVQTAAAQYVRPYRSSENYVRQLLRRLETRSDRFSNLLPNALDQSRLNGTEREDEINSLVTSFEHATDQLRDRFNGDQSTIVDAEMVLREGARIDTFMRNHRLNNRTETAWNQVRRELNQLANTYGVASNWRYRQWPVTGYPTYPSYDAMMTGTYRLNLAASNNPRTVADNATRSMSYANRQRVYDNLINRLTPPDMIAIERRGSSVTLASSRTPQVNLNVDGRERSESFPDGRNSRVRASFIGSELKVESNGNRANDFTATFTPIDNGRRLMVTRQVYVERLASPVMVRSYYDRTSEVASWNIYTGTPGTSPTGNLIFIVPDRTQLSAVLNNDLSTRYSREGDRFTMQVTSPSQYRGATIEGHISNLDRGGRIRGRSEMTFNFDRIRMPDGHSYQFAGIVQEVNSTNGENARVDNEGAVRENDSRSSTAIQRTGIGTAVGALIGAIAGGGKGAAIGAAIGAGAGAGSVYVQGRDDLNLMRGTSFTIQASSPLR